MKGVMVVWLIDTNTNQTERSMESQCTSRIAFLVVIRQCQVKV